MQCNEQIFQPNLQLHWGLGLRNDPLFLRNNIKQKLTQQIFPTVLSSILHIMKVASFLFLILNWKISTARLIWGLHKIVRDIEKWKHFGIDLGLSTQLLDDWTKALINSFGAQKKSKIKLLLLAFYLITNGTRVEPEKEMGLLERIYSI